MDRFHSNFAISIHRAWDRLIIFSLALLPLLIFLHFNKPCLNAICSDGMLQLKYTFTWHSLLISKLHFLDLRQFCLQLKFKLPNLQVHLYFVTQSSHFHLLWADCIESGLIHWEPYESKSNRFRKLATIPSPILQRISKILFFLLLF